MTRNRDDFSAFQALRVGTIGVLLIVAIMVALGLAMANQKRAALERATTVAAATLQFTTGSTEVASAEAVEARG